MALWTLLRRAIAGGGVLAALTACGGHRNQHGFVDHGLNDRSAAAEIHDVSFTSGGATIAGYLVLPTHGHPRAGVVVVHGSGGDRRELLDQAVALAGAGVEALTITEPSSSSPPLPPSTISELLVETKKAQLDDVAAVRAAGDVLAARVGDHLGYLGWSSGAKTGALVGAADHRFRALALMSAGAAPVSAFVAGAPAAERAQVRSTLTAIDPIGAIRRARSGTVLLEDGKHDEIVPRAALLNVVHAAPRGTVVRWYPTGHALSPRAYGDARAWLVAHLA